MSDAQVQPAYKQPWVVNQGRELEILKAKAEAHGMRVEIVAQPGEGFAIGAADCEIGNDQYGVWVLGGRKLEPAEDIDFFHEVDDAWRESREQASESKEHPTGRTKEAPTA